MSRRVVQKDAEDAAVPKKEKKRKLTGQAACHTPNSWFHLQTTKTPSNSRRRTLQQSPITIHDNMHERVRKAGQRARETKEQRMYTMGSGVGKRPCTLSFDVVHTKHRKETRKTTQQQQQQQLSYVSVVKEKPRLRGGPALIARSNVRIIVAAIGLPAVHNDPRESVHVRGCLQGRPRSNRAANEHKPKKERHVSAMVTMRVWLH